MKLDSSAERCFGDEWRPNTDVKNAYNINSVQTKALKRNREKAKYEGLCWRFDRAHGCSRSNIEEGNKKR